MFRKWLWSAAPVVLLVASSAHAQAEAATPTGASVTQVEEVVVTARKQVENVQSVAASVAVVDGTRLAKAGITNFADLSKIVPSINISDSPSLNQFAVTTRGLGSAPGNPSFDSSVATYIDSAFISRDREFGASMFDMGSLEAISGTQASLLGKNSSLGAINLVTTKPGDGYELDARYQHEFQLNSDRIEAGFDLPISNTLKVRVAGFYDSHGGPIEDVISGQKLREKKGGGRITAVWRPSDGIDVTASYQATSNVTTGPNADVLVHGPAANLVATYFGYPNSITSDFYKIAQYSPALGYGQRETLDAQRGVVTANVHVASGTLTSQTGWSASKAGDLGNYSYLPGDGLITNQPDQSEQFTQEVRYAAHIGSRFDYIAGVFYLHSQYKNIATETLDLPLGSTPIPFPINGASSTHFNQSDRAVSVFGQANYRLADPLTLTLGLRYTDERKSADFARTLVVPGTYSLFLSPAVAPFSLSSSKGSVDGSIGLNYKPSSHVLFYATWGQGTKAGGYAATVSNLANSYYRPEVAQTAEVGFKTQLFDRRLTFNGDVFDTAVKAFQVVIFDGQNFVVLNQDVHSAGFESQINWAPIHGLRFYWNNTYADAHDAHTGTKIPLAPRWAGLVGGSYSRDVFGGLRGDIDINVDYHATELAQTQFVGTPYLLPPLSGAHRLNISVGVGDQKRGWEVRLIGQNLTDQHLIGFNFPQPFITSAPGTLNAVQFPLDPMTIKLQFSIKR